MIILPEYKGSFVLCVPTSIGWNGNTDKLELAVTDSARHNLYVIDFYVDRWKTTAFKCTSKLLDIELLPGQYSYCLKDKDTVYGCGVMQVGLTDKKNYTYNQQHQVYVYENTED
jgi:hypothetical protein